jgi:amphi-Trp domain-containing protein
MKKNEVNVKGVLTVSGVNAVLKDLIQSIDAGKICIEHNEVFVTLQPSDQMDFEIKAANKKGKQKIEIELSWREVLPEEDASKSLKISDTEPELPVIEEVPALEALAEQPAPADEAPAVCEPPKQSVKEEKTETPAKGEPAANPAAPKPESPKPEAPKPAAKKAVAAKAKK